MRVLLVLSILLLAKSQLTCLSGEYYNAELNVCLVCSSGCLSCCDENLCSSCNVSTYFVHFSICLIEQFRTVPELSLKLLGL